MFIPFTRVYLTENDKSSFKTRTVVAISEVVGIEQIHEDDGEWSDEYDAGARSVVYTRNGRTACCVDSIDQLCAWIKFDKSA